MKVKEYNVLRKVANHHVVVPLGNKSEFNGVITLNETGVFLQEQLLRETTVEKTKDNLMKEYAVDEIRALSDIQTFIKYLDESKLLD